MKRFYILVAAAAALVGCSVEGDNMPSINVEAKDKFTLMANIADDTRVAISGDKFTEVSWLAGDAVKLSSEAGASATLYAESAGKSVRFVGEGESKAEVDNYYAVYGRTGSYSLSGSVVTLNYAEQYGGAASAAALLVGKAEGVSAADLSMSFSPANALLRVSVSGVGAISKAEFYALDGSSFATSYSYNIATDVVSHTATGSVIVVNAPSASGFFISLPADLDMPNYVVRLTDANGNVCTKAYSAKTFVKGTTTRVDFEWTTPSVTLGAKSSYSYYLADGNNGANANKFTDPTLIYFSTGVNGESCDSSYANVQDAVIEDLGYEIDGVDYTHSAGQVTWNKANNTFVMNSSVSPSYDKTLGNKTAIKAFIKVNGKKVYSTNTVWLTGLPLTSSFIDTTSMPTFWNAAGGYTFEGYSWNGGDSKDYLRLKGNSSESNRGRLYSNAFSMPSSIESQVILDYKYYRSSGSSTTSITIAASSTSISTGNSGEHSVTGGSVTFGDNFGSFADITDNTTLTPSTPCVLITTSLDFGTGTPTAFIGVKTVVVKYREN